jgi:hypothetical protein
LEEKERLKGVFERLGGLSFFVPERGRFYSKEEGIFIPRRENYYSVLQ